MTRKSRILIAGLAATLAAAWIVAAAPGWLADRRAAPAASQEARNDQAPDFTLRDLEGGPFRLSDQRGKPVLLVFGTTWCPSCQEEIPHLKDIYARYAGRGLVIANIHIQESRDKVSRHAEKNGLPYRSLLDENGAVAELYGIRGVPALILLDETGRIVGGRRFIDQSLATMFKRLTANPSSLRWSSTAS